MCHNDANCTDTDGSYECTCKEGYTGNGTFCTGTITIIYKAFFSKQHFKTYTFNYLTCTFCADVDECTEVSPCDVNANCTNTKGSFICECSIGYTGDGKNCSSMS